ncbi:MAG: GNAT family N-acetyltransferase [Candidatus Methanoplasma sp.]|jgi:ribosomal-protein-alanine N-acetyltransferase|nr:GNAT family N-acetyltransferase [Candidatus Methanoplasma sp.]
MLIRQMTARDIDRAYEIACRSLEESYAKDVLLYFMSQWPAGQLVAVSRTGDIVGFISGARLTTDKVSIQLFAVEHEYRNAGVGSRLIDEFKAQTVIDGKHYIQLEMRCADTYAASFYKNKGFSIIEHLKGFYSDGGDATRMMCDIKRDT